MTRRSAGAVLVVLSLCVPADAQQDIRRATIKKIDADKSLVVLSVDGKDLSLKVSANTRFLDFDKQTFADIVRGKKLQEGAQVQFIAGADNSLVALKLAEGAAQPKGTSQGKIKKIDTDKKTVTLTVDGKDRDFGVTDSTRFMGPNGPLQDGLASKELKAGADVMFKAVQQGGKEVLIGMRLDGQPAKGKANPPAKIDLSAFKPLTELGNQEYQGFKGGLYLDGKNERPAKHEAAGVAIAKAIETLDAGGKASRDGNVVMLSVGMSNTTQVFSVFKKLADADKDKNPNLVIVDGAQGGMTAARICKLDSDGGKKFWAEVDRRLKVAGATREQVQVAWIKQANAGPSEGFPAYARTLQEQLGDIVRLMQTRFPNLKIVYLSSRTFAGYATTRLNPEPYAYESGLSVRWLIEQQLRGGPELNHDRDKGKVTAPWLSWGPYLWANGKTKRADGFFYDESDFAKDGTHPSAAGQRKVAELLLHFMKSDTTARPWFVRK